MKPINRLISAAVAVCAVNPAFAGDSCKSGDRKLDLNAPCIPAKLVDYLYCLQESGGGKVEFKSKEGSEKSSAYQITFGGKASGIIVQEDASGGYTSSEIATVVRELREKLDPKLTANCKKIANELAQCKTVKRTYSASKDSDWQRTNWSETLNPSLDLFVKNNEQIIGGQVQTKGDGVIFVSSVTISPDGRTAHAQCAAQYNSSSRGFCRISAMVDVTEPAISCP